MSKEQIDINPALLDMWKYHLPEDGDRQTKITKIHIPLPGKNENIDFDIYNYEMLFNDEETKRIIREGKTIGCFYIESPGMRSLLKRLSCDTFEMLTAASSVIRPGVAQSGMMQKFIACHKDPQKRKYLVPGMEKYLGETYGVMIYQEDVIKIAHHIAGLTLEEADLLRRAMSGKMRSHKAMQQLSQKFFVSCQQKRLIQKEAKELWRQIESFAGYAFCKAHSASFALLSFQVAYLKVHYPAQFMASVLNNRGGYYSPAVYVQECKRMGLTILLPSVNESDYNYVGNNKTIRIGLTAIKNLSGSSINRIVKERKNNGRYVSLADFLIRTKLCYEETGSLIKCGAMDCFAQTRPTMLRLLDIYMRYRNILEDKSDNLFFVNSFSLEEKVITEMQYNINEICTIEYESFGYMVTCHPLDFFKNVIDRPGIVKAEEMYKYNSRKIKMIGWYMASKRIKTKKQEIMKFLSLEDLTGTFEAVIFPKAYAKYAELTMSMGPYLVEGKVDTDNGNSIAVEKLAVLSAKEVRAITQKDSGENQYFGDVEKISEEEFGIVDLLGKEQLRKAYV